MNSFKMAKENFENYVYRIPPWLPTRILNVLSEEDRKKIEKVCDKLPVPDIPSDIWDRLDEDIQNLLLCQNSLQA